MKFGIVGCGMIARFHARAIQDIDGAELACAFDHSSDRARAFGEEFGVQGYADLDEMLAHEGLEIVTIATPSGAHLEPCLAAARAGKHVICEKPLEVTLDRVDQMIEACQAAGVTLAGVFDRRFNPAVEAVRRAVDQGRFGKIVSCSASIKWFRTQEYYDQAAWRGTWALDGGGALMNQSIHTIDKLLLFGGPVESVVAQTELMTHERIEVEDNAVAMLKFRSGAFGVIEASTSCWASGGNPATVTVCGDQGTVTIADEEIRAWDFDKAQPGDDEIMACIKKSSEGSLGGNDPTAIHHHGHKRNFEDVLQAIRVGRDPTVSGREARKPIALIRAIYESAECGSKRVLMADD